MRKPASFSLFLSLFLVVLFGAGCASTVTVTSDSPGAFIRYRGHGRPVYPWRYADNGFLKNAGDECRFRTYYSTVDVKAMWIENDKVVAESDVQTIPLSNWHDPKPVKLNRKR